KIIVSYCLWSWSRVYATPLEDWVAADVIPAIDRIAGDCVETEGEAIGAMVATVPIPSNYLSAGLFTNEKWHRLFVENRPGGGPAGAPFYVAQGLDDPVVRPTVTADFVAGLCRAGE